MYKALLFATDGDWVTDCKAETVDEVIERMSNLGSRWFFYPIQCFVIRDNGRVMDNQRIIDACEPFSFLKNKTVGTTRKFIEEHGEQIF